MTLISAVIVTWNEETNIARAINSIKPFVDEVVVADMSTDNLDKTKAIAAKLGAKVYSHPYTGYVEPARNFAIGKATGKWIFLLDADEEISPELGARLRDLTQADNSYYEVPRKNIIFGKWIMHTRFWPDYLIRLFKKGALTWPEKIHAQPTPQGQGQKLEILEQNAITHHHYQTVSQFISRMNRYTDYQLKALDKPFDWKDLIRKPTNEFLSRFYFGEGYKDGLHGLALSLLQSFSEFVLYLKLWESKNFTADDETNLKNLTETEIGKSIVDWNHWVRKTGGFANRVKYFLHNQLDKLS